MPELICDTTVVQYLHQIGLLHILPALSIRIVVPGAVADEISVGRANGVDLPEIDSLGWLQIASPHGRPALPDAGDLGAGESEVIWLAGESREAVAVLDDGKAREVAARVGVAFTGTLGLLLDAKRAGLIPALAPAIDELRKHNFYLTESARRLILQQAGESP